uniref:Hyphal_reg_CWP domain-containing protein n=1 Tax=Enterobius vermicularis TaxID=51028 RepID=A0A0N4VQI7_ENTVE
LYTLFITVKIGLVFFFFFFQIHSISSNISIVEQLVVVTSSESEINFTEQHVSGNVWCKESVLQFGLYGESENLSAQHDVNALFNIGTNSRLHLTTDNLELYMGTNRTTDGQSLVLLDGNSSSNIAFQSSVGQVEIANTSWFSIRALTWRLSLSARLTVASTFSDGHRHLVISVITNDYSIDITVEDGNLAAVADSHNVEVIGGYTDVLIATGNVTLNISNYFGSVATTLLPPLHFPRDSSSHFDHQYKTGLPSMTTSLVTLEIPFNRTISTTLSQLTNVKVTIPEYQLINSEINSTSTVVADTVSDASTNGIDQMGYTTTETIKFVTGITNATVNFNYTEFNSTTIFEDISTNDKTDYIVSTTTATVSVSLPESIDDQLSTVSTRLIIDSDNDDRLTASTASTLLNGTQVLTEISALLVTPSVYTVIPQQVSLPNTLIDVSL